MQGLPASKPADALVNEPGGTIIICCMLSSLARRHCGETTADQAYGRGCAQTCSLQLQVASARSDSRLHVRICCICTVLHQDIRGRAPSSCRREQVCSAATAAKGCPVAAAHLGHGGIHEVLHCCCARPHLATQESNEQFVWNLQFGSITFNAQLNG